RARPAPPRLAPPGPPPAAPWPAVACRSGNVRCDRSVRTAERKGRAKRLRRFALPASTTRSPAKAQVACRGRACAPPRGAGAPARARSALRPSFSRRLFERSSRSERSEFRRGAGAASIAGHPRAAGASTRRTRGRLAGLWPEPLPHPLPAPSHAQTLRTSRRAGAPTRGAATKELSHGTRQTLQGRPRHDDLRRRAVAQGLPPEPVLHVADEAREPGALQGERARLSRRVADDRSAEAGGDGAR